jgi:urease accessory protein
MSDMLDVVEIVRRGAFDPEGAVDRLTLDHDHRLRRRIVLTTESGRQVRLVEARPVQLRDGDGLRLADGAIVQVDAAPEPLVEITAHDTAALVRIAWHLGNRHLPTQLVGETLRIRRDHVIEEMVVGLGGHCRHVALPFDPEGGAYEGRGGGHHHHDGDDDHHHGHAHG